MSLPRSWVDRIFEKLSVRYGQAFLRKWDGVDMEIVKDDWAEELAGFSEHGDSIGWALQNLPAEKPPNVGEFRAIVNRAPATNVPRIERQAKEVPEQIKVKIEQITKPTRGKDYKAWAKALMARLEGGDKTLTKAQIDMARDALKGMA